MEKNRQWLFVWWQISKDKNKTFNNKTTTTFYGKARKKGIKCVCLSAMVIDYVFKSNVQIQNKREVKSFIGEDLESLSEDKTEKKR